MDGCAKVVRQQEQPCSVIALDDLPENGYYVVHLTAQARTWQIGLKAG